jgi:PAS domain S-box-containing protein
MKKQSSKAGDPTSSSMDHHADRGLRWQRPVGPDLREIHARLLSSQEELRLQHSALLELHAVLRVSHQHYADLFHFAPVGYVILNATGHIQEINETAATMLGAPRAAMKRTLFVSNVFREDLSAFFDHLHRCRRVVGQVATEMRLRRGDGTFFFAQLITASAREGLEQSADLRTTIVDLTKIKQIEAELRAARDELESRVQERTHALQATNERLEAEIARRSELESELIEISERERRRFGQDLHDDTCQSLAGLSMIAKVVASKLAAGKDRAGAAAELAQLGEELHALVEQTRNIARGLHPVALNGGLAPALHELAGRVSEKVPCTLLLQHEPPLDDSAALALYRIAQESTTNAIRHSNASRIKITLSVENGAVVLQIEDDGQGLPKSLDSGAKGLGLDIMEYRARTIGAHLRIERLRRRGTRISCVVPSPAVTRGKPADSRHDSP